MKDNKTNNEEKEYITISYDDGEDVEYEVMGVIDVEEKEYIVMIPETDKDAIEIFGLKEVPEDPDSEEIFVIEDDQEYVKVVEALRKQGLKINIEN